MKKISNFFLFSLILIGETNAFSQEIPIITIYGLRTTQEKLYKTYSYESLPLNDLRSSTSLNVVQNGPGLQFSSTFTRGTNANHTLLTLNGIAIKDASTIAGADDILQHSFSSLQSLEIIKGPMSNIYGPDAVGGVVNMVTQPNDKNWIDLSYGSHNTFNQKIKLGKIIGKTIIDLQGENESSRNISINPSGSETDPYRFRNYTIQTESLLDYDYKLKFNVIKQTNHTNLDDLSSDRENYTGLYIFKNKYLSLQNKESELTINNTRHDREYNKTDLIDRYYSNNDTILAKTTFHNIADFQIGTEHVFTHGKFNTNIDDYKSDVDKQRENHAYFLNITKSFSEDFLMNGSLRYDNPTQFKSQFTERIGGYYNGFRASVATGFSKPTLYQMYGKDEYGFLGNKDLLPEETITYEIGYKNKDIDVALFKNNIKNLFIYDNSRNIYANDKDGSIRKGIETKINQTLLGLDFKNSNTYLVAQDSNGNELVRRPKWINNFEVAYNQIRNTSINANWNYYGKHADIDPVSFKTININPLNTIDFGATYKIKNLDIYGKLNNVTNEQYQRPKGYSTLGRNFLIGFRQEF